MTEEELPLFEILEKADEILIPNQCPKFINENIKELHDEINDPISGSDIKELEARLNTDIEESISENLDYILNNKKCLNALDNNLNKTNIRKFVESVNDILIFNFFYKRFDLEKHPINIKRNDYDLYGKGDMFFIDMIILPQLVYEIQVLIKNIKTQMFSIILSSDNINTNVSKASSNPKIIHKMNFSLILLLFKTLPKKINYLINDINEIFGLPICKLSQVAIPPREELAPVCGDETVNQEILNFKIPLINKGLINSLQDIFKTINTIMITVGVVFGIILLIIIILSIIIGIENKKIKKLKN